MTDKKRADEQALVSQMIAIYCRGKHGKSDKLCPVCAELDTYARHRSAHCPFMETKTFCSNCRVHCYRAEMRQKIRQVMRYAGPRMLFYHPVVALRHMAACKRERKRLEKAE